jgi:hypothetical protein
MMIAALLLIGAAPVSAQDLTPTAAPIFDWVGLTVIVQWGIIAVLILALVAQRRMVPPEVVRALVEQIREAAERTPTTWDDGAARLLDDLTQRVLGDTPTDGTA